MRLEEEAKQWMEERNMSTITATEYQNKAADTAALFWYSVAVIVAK